MCPPVGTQRTVHTLDACQSAPRQYLGVNSHLQVFDQRRDGERSPRRLCVDIMLQQQLTSCCLI